MKRGLPVLVLTLMAVGCVTPSYEAGKWPPGIPPEDHFRKVYNDRKENHALASEEEYMTWIQRFYIGWHMVPNGWQQTEKIILKNVKPEDYQYMKAKVAYLGYLISGEWALHKKIRRIDTRMLIIWGNLVKKAKTVEDKERMLDLAIADAEALLKNELKGADIQVKRYKKKDTAQGNGDKD